MTADTLPSTAALASMRPVRAAEAPPKPDAIKLEGVSVQRGTQLVLRDVSTKIASGAVTAVVGRSGVGKTTLICLLNGLLRPRSGIVSVAGIGPLVSAAAVCKHRRGTATVFQEHALIGRLSAMDNVLLGLADQRHPLTLFPWPDWMVLRAAEALRDVGLLDRAATRVSRLSGGERQRVGIARALVRRPDLLLADEPFASVDVTLVRQFSQEIVTAVSRTGMTVVIVLHQIEIARNLADRIIGLSNGSIAYDGPSADFDTAAETRIFGGEAK